MKLKKALLMGSIACVLGVGLFWSKWCHKGKIASSGGFYFPFRVEVPVERCRQSDANWRYEKLATTPNTVGQEGCALASAVMVLNYYRFDTNPKYMNEFLRKNGGYTDQGWIYWEKAAEFVPQRVQKEYEDLPSYYLIDRNLMASNPVVIRLKKSNGKNHFVVIVGKVGFEYLIADPGGDPTKAVYPLSELTPTIDALRFYAPSP